MLKIDQHSITPSKMAKITCLFLCIVSACLTKVSAMSDAEKAVFHEAMTPIIKECSSEHGVSEGDIETAKEAYNVDGIKPCFLGCVMKKTELIDSKGLYAPEKGLEKFKKFVSDDDFVKFEEIAKQCVKVNDEAVSDGDAGCDRAKLIVACAIEHKAEIPI